MAIAIFTQRFTSHDADGRTWDRAECGRHAAVVICFAIAGGRSSSDVPELDRIHGADGGRAVLFLAVAVDRKPMPTAAPLDPYRILARLAAATIGSQAGVLTATGRSLHLGRVADRVLRPVSADWRYALDAVVAARPVARLVMKSIGCAIPFVR